MNYEDRMLIRLERDRDTREKLRRQPRPSVVPVLKRELRSTLDGLIVLEDGRVYCTECGRKSSKFSNRKHEVACVHFTAH